MIILISAISINNAIGKNNKLLWHLPNDFKRFKYLTNNKVIIMGRKTYESIGKPLPNRINVVITRDLNYNEKGIEVFHSLEKAIQKYPDVYIIGGSSIYKESIKIADHLDITLVHENFEADTFFPKIDLNIWEEIFNEFHGKDEKHKYDYSFIRYKRIK